MKKTLHVLLAAVGVVLLSIVSSLGYNYYEDQKYLSDFEEDTVSVQEQILQITDPVFSTVDEVYQYYDNKTDEAEIDSIFTSMSPDVLINIAQVCIGRDGKTTKRGIVYEYRQRYESLYKYIKPDIEIQTMLQDKDSAKAPPKNGTVVDTIDVTLK